MLNALQKNISGALMVLEQMKLADVKPDSATYSCLISNCDNEDQITKVIWDLYFSQGTMSPFLYARITS